MNFQIDEDFLAHYQAAYGFYRPEQNEPKLNSEQPDNRPGSSNAPAAGQAQDQSDKKKKKRNINEMPAGF